MHRPIAYELDRDSPVSDLYSRARARQNSTQAKVFIAMEDKDSTIEDKVLQVCPYGSQKVISIKGLRTYQGKKKCSAKKWQRGASISTS